jgi:hypothetical protein
MCVHRPPHAAARGCLLTSRSLPDAYKVHRSDDGSFKCPTDDGKSRRDYFQFVEHVVSCSRAKTAHAQGRIPWPVVRASFQPNGRLRQPCSDRAVWRNGACEIPPSPTRSPRNFDIKQLTLSSSGSQTPPSPRKAPSLASSSRVRKRTTSPATSRTTRTISAASITATTTTTTRIITASFPSTRVRPRRSRRPLIGERLRAVGRYPGLRRRPPPDPARRL